MTESIDWAVQSIGWAVQSIDSFVQSIDSVAQSINQGRRGNQSIDAAAPVNWLSDPIRSNQRSSLVTERPRDAQTMNSAAKSIDWIAEPIDWGC